MRLNKKDAGYSELPMFPNLHDVLDHFVGNNFGEFRFRIHNEFVIFAVSYSLQLFYDVMRDGCFRIRLFENEGDFTFVDFEYGLALDLVKSGNTILVSSRESAPDSPKLESRNCARLSRVPISVDSFKKGIADFWVRFFKEYLVPKYKISWDMPGMNELQKEVNFFDPNAILIESKEPGSAKEKILEILRRATCVYERTGNIPLTDEDRCDLDEAIVGAGKYKVNEAIPYLQRIKTLIEESTEELEKFDRYFDRYEELCTLLDAIIRIDRRKGLECIVDAFMKGQNRAEEYLYSLICRGSLSTYVLEYGPESVRDFLLDIKHRRRDLLSEAQDVAEHVFEGLRDSWTGPFKFKLDDLLKKYVFTDEFKLP